MLMAVSLMACGQSTAKTGQSATTNRGTAASQTPAASGAQTASEAASEYQKSMLEWTRCMREHGVPDFPDPDAEGRFLIPKSIDVDSAAFKEAAKACADKFPSRTDTDSAQATAALLNQALEYAKCMRANGVPDFPDPQIVNGHVIMPMPAGIDRTSEVFKKAQAACRSKRPVGLGG